MMKIIGAIMMKDEERNILKSIKSFQNHCDAFVFLDTGSTDKTIEIVNDYCTKNKIEYHLFCHPFKNFSETRNILLDQIQLLYDEKDFIFLIDVNDELITKYKKSDIKNIFEQNNCDCIMISMEWKHAHNQLTLHKTIRIIKNNGSSRYVYHVHEVIMPIEYLYDDNNYEIAKNSCLSAPEIKEFTKDILNFYQDRDDDDESKSKRFEKDVEMLTESFIRYPEEIRVIYYLGQSYIFATGLKNNFYYAKYFYDLRTEIDQKNKSDMSDETGNAYLMSARAISFIMIEQEKEEKNLSEKEIEKLYYTNDNKIYIDEKYGIKKLRYTKYDEINAYLNAYNYCSTSIEPILIAASTLIVMKKFIQAKEYLKMVVDREKPFNCRLMFNHYSYDFQRYYLMCVASYHSRDKVTLKKYSNFLFDYIKTKNTENFSSYKEIFLLCVIMYKYLGYTKKEIDNFVDYGIKGGLPIDKKNLNIECYSDDETFNEISISKIDNFTKKPNIKKKDLKKIESYKDSQKSKELQQSQIQKEKDKKEEKDKKREKEEREEKEEKKDKKEKEEKNNKNIEDDENLLKLVNELKINKMTSEKLNTQKDDRRNIFIFGGFYYCNWDDCGFDKLGGSETIILNLVKKFSETNKYNIFLCAQFSPIFIYNDEYKKKWGENVEIVPIQKYNEYIKKYNYECLIVSRFIDYMQYLDNIKKFIFLQQDSGYITQKNKVFDYDGVDEKLNYHVFMSKNQMERFINNNNMKKNKKHTVIHGAIDVEHYNNQLFTSIKKQKLRFIYTTCIERGLISLVEQFEKIRKTYPEATLYIFSDFSGKYNNLGNEVIENLKTRIREIGNIYINNRVDQQTLAIEFMKSEYWIYPANCPETFCISAVEAMAAGCFCIYKNIGALPEVVHVKGACIDNDDEIYNIVYNAEETDDKTNIKKRLSYSARLTAMSKYNYDVFFDKWISLIDL